VASDVKRTAVKIDKTKKLSSDQHELERGSKNIRTTVRGLLGKIRE